MPPRKPKQPARRKNAPAGPKAPSKKTSAKKAAKKESPETEGKIAAGVGVAVGVGQTVKSTFHEELEARMARAIHEAHAEGLTHPDDIRARILKAREDHLNR